MYLPRRPLSARWWPGQGHAVNDALTLRSTVTNSNRATPFGGHPVARWRLGMIAICQAAGCPASRPGRWLLRLLADTCGTRAAGCSDLAGDATLDGVQHLLRRLRTT
jgi:hypothetical protein